MPPARDDHTARDGDSGKVLSPDELDIEQSESVVSIDEDRYVIGAGGRPSVPDGSAELPSADASQPASTETTNDAATGGSTTGRTTESAPAPSTEGGSIDAGDVRQWLEDDLGDVSSRYGFHITAKSENRISHQQMFSDDVGTVFDGLLMWYAQQVDRNTPVEDVLGILLTESNLRVRYSHSSIRGVLDSHDALPISSPPYRCQGRRSST